MKELGRLKAAMRKSPETAAMLMPSGKREIFIDLNGDGKADFAFLDTTDADAIDTFAVDTTNNGEFNLYTCDSDGNGVGDQIRFYPDGSDTPAQTIIGDEVEKKLAGLAKGLRAALKGGFDASRFIEAMRTYKSGMMEAFESFQSRGTLGIVKEMLRADDYAAKLIMPSAKNEIFFDLDGDGKGDFALISSAHNNELDTFAMDMTGTGEFDLYFRDTDGNGICDQVIYYAPGSVLPSMFMSDTALEASLAPITEKFRSAFVDGFTGEKLVNTLREIKADILKMGAAFHARTSMSGLKAKFLADPETAKLVMPSTKGEIFLDLDGDGKADFGLLDHSSSDNVDTLALDLTGDGEFDLYLIDTDGNGLGDDIRYYAPGATTPSYALASKAIEKEIEGLGNELIRALTGDLKAAEVVDVLKKIKAGILAAADKFQTRGTLGVLRRNLLGDAATCKMVMPSTKSEIFLDLDGDGKADFAFMDSKFGDRMDTFAVDMTGDGEFNLYFVDTDGNGIGDDVRYYAPGSDEPAYVAVGADVEKAIGGHAMKLLGALHGKFDGAAFVAVLKELKAAIDEAAAKAQAQA